LTAVVVLPTPPFWLTTDRIWPTRRDDAGLEARLDGGVAVAEVAVIERWP